MHSCLDKIAAVNRDSIFVRSPSLPPCILRAKIYSPDSQEMCTYICIWCTAGRNADSFGIRAPHAHKAAAINICTYTRMHAHISKSEFDPMKSVGNKLCRGINRPNECHRQDNHPTCVLPMI